MSEGTPPVRDLLKLSPDAFSELVSKLDAAATGYAGGQRREHERLRSTDVRRVLLATHVDDLALRELHRVRGLDISKGGMAVLHGAFVYPDERVAVLMPKTDGSPAKLDAVVRRCRLLTGRVHELGLRFDEAIDPGEFLADAASVEQSRKQSPSSDSNSWTDLLKLRPQEIEQIRKVLQLKSKRGDGAARKSERATYHEGAILAVLHADKAAQRQVLRVTPIDLSNGGISFLHGAFLHPGTPCDAILPSMTGEMVQIPGTVAGCRFVRGRAHAVGVAFSEEIDTSTFIALDDDASAA